MTKTENKKYKTLNVTYGAEINNSSELKKLLRKLRIGTGKIIFIVPEENADKKSIKIKIAGRYNLEGEGYDNLISYLNIKKLKWELKILENDI